jgi:hypothetical protein
MGRNRKSVTISQDSLIERVRKTQVLWMESCCGWNQGKLNVVITGITLYVTNRYIQLPVHAIGSPEFRLKV